MEYTINDLGSWLTQLLILEADEKKLRKDYGKTIREAELLYSDATYLDTSVKISEFQKACTFFKRKLNKLSTRFEHVRLELKAHCMIIPKGPVFKISHSIGTFKMSRKAGFVDFQLSTGNGHFSPDRQIRYVFPEIIIWSDKY